MYDLIVVGGGPAGLTASIYALRKRLNVLMVSKDLGGKTNFQLELPFVESYQVISGVEVVNKFRNELEYLEFARHMELVERIDREDGFFSVHTQGGGKLNAKAIILATGARQQRLDVPGEREYLSKGLCYSALSYAPLFVEKDTVVIGDGELALRSAAELSTVAKHVHLVGPTGEILKTVLGEKLQQRGNVTILEGFRVTRVQGNGYANAVSVKGPDGEESQINADGTFVELALIPNSDMVQHLVDVDEVGRVKVDCFNRTSVPGFFAAGDVTNIFAEQVLIAVGEGAKAALSAYEYLLPLL